MVSQKNRPADTHNLATLEAFDSSWHNIPFIDLIFKNVSPQKIEEVLNRYQVCTGGLARLFHIKVNVRAMLIVNIDVKDSNRQLSTIMHIAKNHRN